MNEISKEYAKALFELALENGSEEEYKEALELVLKVFSKNDNFVEFLSSPEVSSSEKLDVAEKAFSDSLPKEVMSFLKILCEKRYIKHFKDCAVEYKKMLDEKKKTLNAKVISAVALSEAEKTKLKEKLEKMSGYTVELECALDSSILGGMIVEIDGKTVDASIMGRLKNVKDVIGV